MSALQPKAEDWDDEELPGLGQRRPGEWQPIGEVARRLMGRIQRSQLHRQPEEEAQTDPSQIQDTDG